MQAASEQVKADAKAFVDDVLAVVTWPGRKLGQAIPTNLEMIFTDFAFVKYTAQKENKVNAGDARVLQEALDTGMLSNEDAKLAASLLSKIRGS